MALSTRKNSVVMDVKDVAPPLVNNSNRPHALPVEMQRIVISYLLTPASILEEVKALDEKFGDETMAPFRKAIESKIDPLWSKPTLSQIYQTKPKKSNMTFVENTPEVLFDDVIKEISHRPVEEQLDFLRAMYEEEWDRQEGHFCFRRAKEKIKKIYENCHLVGVHGKYSSAQLKEHIAQQIFAIMNQFICTTIINSYQDSPIIIISSNDHPREEKSVLFDELLLSQAQNTQSRSFCCTLFMTLFALAILGGTGMFIMGEAKHDNTLAVVGGSLMGGSLLVAACGFIFACLADRHDGQAHFLTTVRDRFFQLESEATEAKSDNKLAEPLLSAEQQDEYKNDEESNLRPDSP